MEFARESQPQFAVFHESQEVPSRKEPGNLQREGKLADTERPTGNTDLDV
jgi:hypothetical protein